MYSIDITAEYPIFDDVLSYAATFDNIKCFNELSFKLQAIFEEAALSNRSWMCMRNCNTVRNCATLVAKL